MKAAFEAGADVVELDVHLTPDNVFAVFHDWTLDCRTDGSGQTNKTLFSDLQNLDVGYNYSSDGTTYPLRGSGMGLIPSLTEVFDTFPNQRFLINFKSNRRSEGSALARLLAKPQYRDQVFGVYGGEKPTRAVIEAVESVRGFSWGSVRTCLLRYQSVGWAGYVPRVCRGQILAVPINYAPYIWGWPLRFQRRMAVHDSTIILVGPYVGGRRVNGIDTPDLVQQVPSGFAGYVWTNEIDQIRNWSLE